MALQYAPCEGIPSLREYLIDRQEATQGVRPEFDELVVTSGGMECIALACQSLIDPGDTVAVEAPTYLGALMAFDRYEAEVEGIPIDGDGLLVDALEERLAGGLRRSCSTSSPSTRTRPAARCRSPGARRWWSCAGATAC